jgi:hypothetical protein
VADLAAALRTGARPRADGELGYHILDVMECLHTAAASGTAVTVPSTCEIPPPVPLG